MISVSAWMIAIPSCHNFGNSANRVELLAKRGFKTSAVASERERTPGVLSEVCMVYATRPRHVIDELKSPRSKSPRKRRA